MLTVEGLETSIFPSVYPHVSRELRSFFSMKAGDDPNVWLTFPIRRSAKR
ncbi:hypothetical protein [Singulisphaera sp. PoT]